MKDKIVEYLSETVSNLNKYREGMQKQVEQFEEQVKTERQKMLDIIEKIDEKVKELNKMLKWLENK